MLPKRFRLRNSNDFKQVYRKGKVADGEFSKVICHFRAKKSDRDNNGKMPRVGIVTSTKVGKAAVRNQVKRRMTEILRPIMPGIKDNIWCVIVAKKSAAVADFNETKVEIESQLKKLEVLI